MLSAIKPKVRYTNFLFALVTLAVATTLSSCEETTLPAAQKFAGDYSATTWLYGYDDTTETTTKIEVFKTGDEEVYYTDASGNVPYSVNGSAITQKANTTKALTVDSMGTMLSGKYIQTSTGSISGKTLTITGTYALSGRKTLSFKTVANKE